MIFCESFGEFVKEIGTYKLVILVPTLGILGVLVEFFRIIVFFATDNSVNDTKIPLFLFLRKIRGECELCPRGPEVGIQFEFLRTIYAILYILFMLFLSGIEMIFFSLVTDFVVTGNKINEFKI